MSTVILEQLESEPGIFNSNITRQLEELWKFPWDSMKFHLTSGWLRRTLPRNHTFLKGWHVTSRLRSGWCTGHGDLQPRQGREHVWSSQLVELQNSPVTCLCNIYIIWYMMYDVWYTTYAIWYMIYDIYIYTYNGQYMIYNIYMYMYTVYVYVYVYIYMYIYIYMCVCVCACGVSTSGSNWWHCLERLQLLIRNWWFNQQNRDKMGYPAC